jgi:hypothetical protein
VREYVYEGYTVEKQTMNYVELREPYQRINWQRMLFWFLFCNPIFLIILIFFTKMYLPKYEKASISIRSNGEIVEDGITLKKLKKKQLYRAKWDFIGTLMLIFYLFFLSLVFYEKYYRL